MLVFTLAIACLICLDSWTSHYRFLCNIAHYSIGSCFHHQSHPQLGVFFVLALSLHFFSGVISPLIPSSILGTYRPGEFIFQCLTFLPFHTAHGIPKAGYRNCLPLPSPVDHILSELSNMTHPCWVALHSMALSFIKLDKAIAHVIRLVSFM